MSLHRISVTLIMAAFLLPVSALSADEIKPSLNGPSFKALIKISNNNLPSMTSKSDVWVSKHGLRIAVSGDQNRTMITLVKETETYMLFPEQRMYMSSSDIEKEADNVVDEGPMTLFSNEPCMGYKKSKKANSTKVAGRKVTKWFCGNAQGIDNTVHFYDDKLRRVIKSQMPDGTVSELLNIEQKSLPRKLFEIPKDYKKMSLGQMIMPPGMNLEPYAETQ